MMLTIPLGEIIGQSKHKYPWISSYERRQCHSLSKAVFTVLVYHRKHQRFNVGAQSVILTTILRCHLLPLLEETSYVKPDKNIQGHAHYVLQAAV